MSNADLSIVVSNARIKTGDAARPWATALGIRDRRLAVIGNAAEILKMASADCRIVDARGQVVALPHGLAVGSNVSVSVASDGVVAIHASQEES